MAKLDADLLFWYFLEGLWNSTIIPLSEVMLKFELGVFEHSVGVWTATCCKAECLNKNVICYITLEQFSFKNFIQESKRKSLLCHFTS